MFSSALVVVCALELLGRSATQLPPIKVLETPPPGVSANAQAFVDRSQGVIYLIASAPAFHEAASAQQKPWHRGRCVARPALKMVASIIVHEEWHVKHGGDERGAYLAQLTELNRLGLAADSWAAYSVTRAMRAAVDAEARRRRASQTVAVAR